MLLLMKRLSYPSLLLLFASLLFSSCTKERIRIDIRDEMVGTYSITSGGNNLPLSPEMEVSKDPDNEDQIIILFWWHHAELKGK